MALGTGGFFVYQAKFGAKVSANEQVARVTRGDVSKVIEGSGTIEAIDQYDVTSLVKGEILTCTFEEGDMVQQGDLLYALDSSELDNNIQKGLASVEKAQLSGQQTNRTIQNQTVYADTSGVLTQIYVKNGDQVQNGAKLADIVNTDVMVLQIPFHAKDAGNLYAGQSAQVSLESSFTTLSGTVKSVSTGAMSNSEGVSVVTVEIEVGNPGGIQKGDRATAMVGNIACNTAGTFTYSAEETIISKASGEVSGLDYMTGDYIKGGAYFLSLKDDTLSTTIRQNELSVQDAQLALESLYDQKEDYNIKAPISGKVIQKTSKAGDKLDNGNNSTVMAIIADLSTLVFEISVDELDITSISVGQSVQITADAIEGTTFTGYVDNISIVGTSSNGVTSYPVKVVVNDGENSGLIPGMNVSAQIVIESRENVLRVPVSAVQRGNTVYVKDDGAAEQKEKSSIPKSQGATQGERPQNGTPAEDGRKAEGATETEKADKKTDTTETKQENKTEKSNVPDGFHAVKVEVGLSSEDFVEITSGLQEGDTVLIQNKSGSITTNQGMGQGGMMGGMGGGMPGGAPSGEMPGGGGMPSGGMPGGGR
ncbi:MAG: HlyD family efflux transporter periplasmic adaptor subunit [Clostridia bacterium]|nr:HlyD family efflux transporter periplasmic adaptor subunit [Clostridia bacterium]